MQLSERVREAAARVMNGETQAAVARDMGIDPSTVSKALTRVKNRLPEREFDEISILRFRSAEHLCELRQRFRYLAKLDVPPAGYAPRIGKLKPPDQIAAGRVLVQIEQRLAKLYGLDAPVVVAAVAATPPEAMTDAQVAEELARFGLAMPVGSTQAVIVDVDAAKEIGVVQGVPSGPRP